MDVIVRCAHVGQSVVIAASIRGGPLRDQVSFQVANLDAVVAGGIPVEWQGREFASGPLRMTLDSEAGSSLGSLDYSERRARVEFRVTMAFPEFAQTLADLGAASEFSQPLRAVIRSEGPILEDHSFALSGSASVAEHALFDGHAQGTVLPGT
jgi:hypothetical protein